MPPRISRTGDVDPDSEYKDRAEERIEEFFTEQFERQFQEIITEFNYLEGEQPDETFWQLWTAIFTAFLVVEFMEDAIQGAETQQGLLNIGVDHDLLIDQAQAWADDYARSLAQDINRRTAKHIARELQRFLNQPGEEVGQLFAGISTRFNPIRAQSIAITETTRAFQEGRTIYRNELRKLGVTTDEVWHTMEDERVCIVCEPNNLVFKRDGWTVESIPAHPRDRCWTVIVVITEGRNHTMQIFGKRHRKLALMPPPKNEPKNEGGFIGMGDWFDVMLEEQRQEASGGMSYDEWVASENPTEKARPHPDGGYTIHRSVIRDALADAENDWPKFPLPETPTEKRTENLTEKVSETENE